MHIVVCLKQVPDTTEVKIDRKTNTLIREGVASIANPYDLHAVEAALKLKEAYGGKVTVISMGLPQAKIGLKRAVAMGADNAILISDRAFAGADTLATSYTLSQAIRKLSQSGGIDLVLCGKQAIDGDTAQVGPGIATRLGLTQLTYVSKIRSVDLNEKSIIVERRLEDGIEVVKAKLPALITVIKEINELRYSSLPNLIKSIQYEPECWNKSSFDTDTSKLGLQGSPTAVETIFTPPLRGGGIMMRNGSPDFEEKFNSLTAIIKDIAEKNKKEICEI